MATHMTCPHEFWQREAAVETEGYCPICMAENMADIIMSNRMSVKMETIERCAQVAESHYESYCGKRIEQIAAAIRALKDAT